MAVGLVFAPCLSQAGEPESQEEIKSAAERGAVYLYYKDYDKAKDLLEFACNNNDYTSCTYLGLMHEDGNGYPVDLKKAFES